MNDPLIKSGSEIFFYVALAILLIIWILKKRKQLHIIDENTPHKENDPSEQ